MEKFNNLPAKEKEARKSNYEKALAKERNQAGKRQKLPGLSVQKIRENCQERSWKLGNQMYRHFDVKRSVLKKKKWISADVVSSKDPSNMYKVVIEYDLYQGQLTKNVFCGCDSWRLRDEKQRGYLCKHMVAVLLDRCLNANK